LDRTEIQDHPPEIASLPERIVSVLRREITCMRGARVTLIRTWKMIQIRNVPDELHRTLKVRAAKAGMTLSDYLLSEIEKAAEKPTMSEWLERVRSREPVELDERPDVTTRRFRDADDPRDLG
jgi:antitoxin FitA